MSFDTRDSARFMPKCAVIDPAFTWALDKPPARLWHETILYEMHVRGFSMRHPGIEERARGTFGALADHELVDYIEELGVTAVELPPIHGYLHDRHLIEQGLRNYWGYNPLSFFAPHTDYLGAGGINEFKTFVQLLHAAGIEVVRLQ